jgi:hypothetical protein
LELYTDGHLSVSLTQQYFAETLIESFGFTWASVSSFTAPYRSGLSIDSVPNQNVSSADRDILWLQYQSLVGVLNWFAHTTGPDLSMVVSLLAQHQSNPSPGHLESACYVAHYFVKTKTLGI